MKLFRAAVFKTLPAFFLLLSGLLVCEAAPLPYSDLAQYDHLPLKERIAQIEKAGIDMYKRHRYDDAIQIFNIVLALDSKNATAHLWKKKAEMQNRFNQNNELKQQAYKKYDGRLVPKEKFEWPESIGHFEVRYSEYKPNVYPPKEVRQPATDEELKKAKAKTLAKGAKAFDFFELAMLYWSRKETEQALKTYIKAVEMDPRISAKNDEAMLYTIQLEIEEKMLSGEPTKEDYRQYALVSYLQGAIYDAVKYFAASAGKPGTEEYNEARKILSNILNNTPHAHFMSPADLFGFRMLYACEKDGHYIYLRMKLMPQMNAIVIPFDMFLPSHLVEDVYLENSKDLSFVLAEEGMDEYTLRLWLIIREHPDDFHQYDAQLRIKLKDPTESSTSFYLANHITPIIETDNWAFIVTPAGIEPAFYEPPDFVRHFRDSAISAYSLYKLEGEGPRIILNNYAYTPVDKENYWDIMTDNLDAAIDDVFKAIHAKAEAAKLDEEKAKQEAAEKLIEEKVQQRLEERLKEETEKMSSPMMKRIQRSKEPEKTQTD